jgi:hypothetical protein
MAGDRLKKACYCMQFLRRDCGYLYDVKPSRTLPAHSQKLLYLLVAQ